MIESKFDYSKLRGRIKEKLGTEQKFALELHRTRSYISCIFNGKAYFEQRDIDSAALLLDIPQNEIGTYFFEKNVHKNGTIKRAG